MSTKEKKIIMSFYDFCKMEFNVLETIQLLKLNLNVFFSWGISSLVNFNNKGILLTVNSEYHKGYVFIILDYSDTYTVNIINFNGNVLDTYEMVYFDMLTEIIDNRIEKVGKRM